MAQKRMIDKKISVSEQVANLSIPAQLVYTWGVPHADDVGILPSSHRTLKATLVPMWVMELEEFEKLVAEIVSQGLWSEYEFGGERFYRLTNFIKYQTLKRDRQPQTILPIMYSKKPEDSWKFLESLGFHLEDTGFQMDTEVKRREVKRREEKDDKPASSLRYLSNIPPEDMREFLTRFDATERAIKSKAEDLILWCESNGKVKKNYKAFLLNALKRDFRPRPPKQAPLVEEPRKPLTEKQKKSIEDMKKGIGAIAKGMTVKKP